ncbi:hypothetical protein GWK47_012123 [Chionoecetes opilio]|uniref:Uncharacterized protein n=1 Tax=Chionoecetes opilio TaxID=41210 RepID=A0A8J4XXH0_CHIOP|nr:hypothetical protein GWK47_012123 [Chionoecetes opilio]
MCGMRIRTPPPAPQKPSCPPAPGSYPFSKLVVSISNGRPQPISPSLTGYRMARSGTHLIRRRHQVASLITVFPTMVKRFGIPEELSCEGETNLTSQNQGGLLDTWRVRLSSGSKCAKRLLRGNTGRNGSWTQTAAACGPSGSTFNTPPQGLSIPDQLDHRDVSCGRQTCGASLYEVKRAMGALAAAVSATGHGPIWGTVQLHGHWTKQPTNIEPLTPGIRDPHIKPIHGSGRCGSPQALSWARLGTQAVTWCGWTASGRTTIR